MRKLALNLAFNPLKNFMIKKILIARISISHSSFVNKFKTSKKENDTTCIQNHLKQMFSTKSEHFNLWTRPALQFLLFCESLKLL